MCTSYGLTQVRMPILLKLKSECVLLVIVSKFLRSKIHGFDLHLFLFDINSEFSKKTAGY